MKQQQNEVFDNENLLKLLNRIKRLKVDSRKSFLNAVSAEGEICKISDKLKERHYQKIQPHLTHMAQLNFAHEEKQQQLQGIRAIVRDKMDQYRKKCKGLSEFK